MQTKFVGTTSARLPQLSVVNGQLIFLTDTDGAYYDAGGQRRSLSSGGASSPAALGFGYGTCSTAASTAAKVVSLTDYALATGGFVSVTFTNAVPANATMNINNQGAKPIYYKNSAIVANLINAGDTATFVYDGTNYRLLAIDSLIGTALVTE